MELVFTVISVVGGMAFSLAVALLVEEVIFGKVLGLFFVPRTSQAKQDIATGLEVRSQARAVVGADLGRELSARIASRY
jgi:hypothetical protein